MQCGPCRRRRDFPRQNAVRPIQRTLLKLNPWLTADNAHKAVRAITGTPSTSLLDANEKLHTSLPRGISLDQDVGSGKKGQTVRFIDFDCPDATSSWSHANTASSAPRRRSARTSPSS